MRLCVFDNCSLAADALSIHIFTPSLYSSLYVACHRLSSALSTLIELIGNYDALHKVRFLELPHATHRLLRLSATRWRVRPTMHVVCNYCWIIDVKSRDCLVSRHFWDTFWISWSRWLMSWSCACGLVSWSWSWSRRRCLGHQLRQFSLPYTCLLYTSDAADE